MEEKIIYIIDHLIETGNIVPIVILLLLLSVFVLARYGIIKLPPKKQTHTEIQEIKSNVKEILLTLSEHRSDVDAHKEQIVDILDRIRKQLSADISKNTLQLEKHRDIYHEIKDLLNTLILKIDQVQKATEKHNDSFTDTSKDIFLILNEINTALKLLLDILNKRA